MLSDLRTRLHETIARYRSELPGTETGGTDRNRTTTNDRAADDAGVDANGHTDARETGNTGNPEDGDERNRQEASPEKAKPEQGNANDRERTKSSDTNGNGKPNEKRETSEWHVVESPTEKSLASVTTTAGGHFAVGTGGRVLRRGGEGDWRLVVETGPATRKNRLTAIDATGDGRRVWFCGSSGALGAYDVDSGVKYDYSAPKDKTSTWEAIAVTGKRNAERVRVANGSGEVLPVTVDENGCPAWGEVTKPGGGSTIAALDFGGGRCYAVDTSGNVFEERNEKRGKGTDERGRRETTGTAGKQANWADIGIENAQVNFADVFATESRVLVAGGGGRVYRYDRPCRSWTPVDAGDGALYAIDGDGKRTVAVGAGGRIYERLPESGWSERDTPTTADLRSVALDDPMNANGTGGAAESSGDGSNSNGGDRGSDADGADGNAIDVAVGTNGTIVERVPGRPSK